MRRWIRALFVGVVLGTGCAQEAQVAPDPVREWDGELLIDQISIDCDQPDEFLWEVWTQGWGDLVTVEVVPDFLTGLNNEYHQLRESDYGDDWAYFLASLEPVDSPSDVVESESTAIPCDMRGYITIVVAAWRYDGEMGECIAAGTDPSIAPDCADWGPLM